MTEFLDEAIAAKTTTTRPSRISDKTLSRFRAQEPSLIEAWQTNGCEKSLYTLIERYQPMIISQMQKILTGRSVGPSHRRDLQQEATLAFIRAVNKYDPSFGVPLSSFAISNVRKSLLRYALDFRHGYRIGTSSDERKAFYAALSRRADRIHNGESEQLTDEDIQTIAKSTGSSIQSTERAVQSIYARATNIDDATELNDHNDPPKDDQMAISAAMEILSGFISTLNERQAAILDLYLKDEDIDAHILAERFEVTPERIGQIRRDMLADMAIYLKKNGIRAEDLF